MRSHPYLPRHACLTDEGLTRAAWSGERWTAEPRLASKIESDGPLVWKIELREGLKWSNGSPLTASDVSESWRQVLAKAKTFPAAIETLGRVRESRAFAGGKVPYSSVGIDVEGDRLLIVRLQQPAPEFPLWLASPAAWPFKNGTGSGPFLVSSEAAAGESRFPRNPNYWDKAPALDGVRLQNGGTNSTHRIMRFLAGETDAVDQLSEPTAAALSNDPRLKFFPEPRGWFLVLTPSTGSDSWRRSLIRSVDVSETVSVLRWPHHPLKRLTSAVEGAISPWPETPVETTKMPGEDPFDGERYFPLLEHSGASAPETLSLNLQAQWARRLSLSPSAGSPGWIVEAGLDALHPEADLKSWLAGFAEKWGRSKTRALEEKLAAAEATESAETRRKVLETVEQELVRGQALVLPLLGAKQAALVSPRVSGLSKDALGNWDFRLADLEPQNQ